MENLQSFPQAASGLDAVENFRDPVEKLWITHGDIHRVAPVGIVTPFRTPKIKKALDDFK